MFMNISPLPQEEGVYIVTTILPTIPGWKVQWYLYVPAFLKVTVTVLPWSSGLSNFQLLVVLVMVCGAAVRFVHFTFVPTLIVFMAGFNTKLCPTDAAFSIDD